MEIFYCLMAYLLPVLALFIVIFRSNTPIWPLTTGKKDKAPKAPETRSITEALLDTLDTVQESVREAFSPVEDHSWLEIVGIPMDDWYAANDHDSYHALLRRRDAGGFKVPEFKVPDDHVCDWKVENWVWSNKEMTHLCKVCGGPWITLFAEPVAKRQPYPSCTRNGHDWSTARNDLDRCRCCDATRTKPKPQADRHSYFFEGTEITTRKELDRTWTDISAAYDRYLERQLPVKRNPYRCALADRDVAPRIHWWVVEHVGAWDGHDWAKAGDDLLCLKCNQYESNIYGKRPEPRTEPWTPPTDPWSDPVIKQRG